MATAKFISLIQQMDQLIRTNSTGNPVVFASRLCMSERTLYNYLSLLKDHGAPIEYSRIRESYLYTFEGRFIFEFIKLGAKDYAVG